jgi:hypothetical protein
LGVECLTAFLAQFCYIFSFHACIVHYYLSYVKKYCEIAAKRLAQEVLPL